MAETVSALLLKARRQNRGSILVRGIYIFNVPFYVVLYFIIEVQIEERVFSTISFYENPKLKIYNLKTVVYFPFFYFTNDNYNTLYS